MSERLVIALAQLTAVPGDPQANLGRLRAARAEAAGADLIFAPELFLAGYAPLDLLRRPAFVEACRAACEALARETATGPAVLVGLPWAEGGGLYNAMALLDVGRIEAVRFRSAADAAGRFRPGPDPGPMGFRGVRLGVVIGEDAETPDVVECLVETGGEILLAPQVSPYRRDGFARRQSFAVTRVVEAGLPFVSLNGVGGIDEGVLDGGGFVLNADRRLAAQLPGFRDAVVSTVWSRSGGDWLCEPGVRATVDEGDEGDYSACVLALRDFVARSGAAAVEVETGDAASALCAALAADALGPERVRAETGAMRLSPLDRTQVWTGEAAPEGAFAPLIELYRSDVGRLAALRGRWRPEGALGPERVVIPSEPEAPLDGILRGLVDEGRRVGDLVARGFDLAEVQRVEAAIYRSEALRRRAPPGVRLGRAAPRFPLAHGFRDAGGPAQAPDPMLAPQGPRGGAERFEE